MRMHWAQLLSVCYSWWSLNSILSKFWVPCVYMTLIHTLINAAWSKRSGLLLTHTNIDLGNPRPAVGGHSGSHGTAGIQAGTPWDSWLESLMQPHGRGEGIRSSQLEALQRCNVGCLLDTFSLQLLQGSPAVLVWCLDMCNYRPTHRLS